MNNELWSIVFETCKKGDNFYEVIPDSWESPKEVGRIRYLNPKKIERVEDNGKLMYFLYSYNDENNNKIVSNTNFSDKQKEIKKVKLFPWQVVHFKIEDKEFDPYGGSLLKAGARTYKRLVLLEDIMLVYRISRAPERRVFYVDVGTLNPIEAKKFLTKLKLK